MDSLIGTLVVALGISAFIAILYWIMRFLAWVVRQLFDLGRKTAKHNPWRVDRPPPPPRRDEAPTDRIRVALHEHDTDLLSRDELEGQPLRPHDPNGPAR